MATPLGERLTAIIAENGPISIADYMILCLADPEHGYYATHDPLGPAGDFITAPEISQMFGELIGAWLAEAPVDLVLGALAFGHFPVHLLAFGLLSR